jgi:hypothetical protein
MDKSCAFEPTAQTIELVKRMMAAEAERSVFVQKIYSQTPAEKFKGLCGFYKLANPEIIKAGRNEWGIDPYEVDWTRLFTPIESWLWHDIRAVDLVLYPQYPVGRYFVDFANPVAKVAIECDGEAFHQDKAKDAERDAKLAAMGWKVYRISGKDCRDGVGAEHGEGSKARDFVKRIAGNHSINRP